MTKAFAQVAMAQAKTHPGEEVIDTTTPEFAQHFQGFTGGGNEIKYG